MRRFQPEGWLYSTEQNRRCVQDLASLRGAMERGDIVEGRAVLCTAEHDLHVDLPCMRGVIPYKDGALGIEDGSVRDIALLSRVGKTVCFTVEDIEEDRFGNPFARLSRRHAQSLCKEHMLQHYRVGDVIEARVTRLENFGAFCDIGCGLPALLPIACMSVSRITHPRDRVCVGDRIRCVISSMDGGRICLSMRELLGTWEENVRHFSAGETVIGVVRSVEPYGVFVELAPNLAGLAEPREGAAVGQAASVYIKSILPDKMKVKLVIIDLGDRPVMPMPLRYYSDAEHIDHWSYAPSACRRQVESRYAAAT